MSVSVSATSDVQETAVTLSIHDALVNITAQDNSVVTVQAEGSQIQIATIESASTVVIRQVDANASDKALGGTAVQLDYSDTRYWYLEYSTHIKRIDTSFSPVRTGTYFSNNPAADWAQRTTLLYT